MASLSVTRAHENYGRLSLVRCFALSNVFAHHLTPRSARPDKAYLRGDVWPNENRDIRVRAKICIPCQRSKIHRHLQSSPLQLRTDDVYFPQAHLVIVVSMPVSIFLS